MATLLGTPYERGKSEIISSRRTPNNLRIPEGRAFADVDPATVTAVTSGVTPCGVVGQQEVIGLSVMYAGLRTWVEYADADAPVVRGQVYVTPNGLFSATEAGNTPINARFASSEMRTDGIQVNDPAARKSDVKCACIHFEGGF